MRDAELQGRREALIGGLTIVGMLCLVGLVCLLFYLVNDSEVPLLRVTYVPDCDCTCQE